MKGMIASRGSRLSFAGIGNAAETVILLHGGPGMPDYLEEDVARILVPGYRVIRYDQRGSGDSVCRNGRFGLEDHVTDLESILKACGCEKVHLFGHSWGGLLAQLYAAGHPGRIKRLFLCNPLPGVGEDWKRMERMSIAYHLRHGGLSRSLALGALVAGTAAPGLVGRWAARRMTALAWRDFFDPFPSPPLGNAFLAGISAKAFSHTRRAALRANAARLDNAVFPQPEEVAILFGERDFLTALADRVYSRYPQARQIRLPGAGHWPWIENPPEFRRELCRFFVRGIEPG